jgi:hypothetical protein
MTPTSHSRDTTRQQGVSTTNLVFQMEVLANSEGEREICHDECDPTNHEPTDDLEANDLGADSWEFTFTLPANFDGTESVFGKFQLYRLDPDVVVDACAKAAGDRAP